MTKKICLLLVLVLSLLTTSCKSTEKSDVSDNLVATSNGISGQSISSNSIGTPELDQGYSLKVQLKNEKSGIICITDPNLKEEYEGYLPEIREDESLYHWGVYFGDCRITVQHGNFEMYDGKKVGLEDMNVYFEMMVGSEYKKFEDISVSLSGKNIILQFSFPDSTQVDFKSISEYKVRIENMPEGISYKATAEASKVITDDLKLNVQKPLTVEVRSPHQAIISMPISVSMMKSFTEKAAANSDYCVIVNVCADNKLNFKATYGGVEAGQNWIGEVLPTGMLIMDSTWYNKENRKHQNNFRFAVSGNKLVWVVNLPDGKGAASIKDIKDFDFTKVGNYSVTIDEIQNMTGNRPREKKYSAAQANDLSNYGMQFLLESGTIQIYDLRDVEFTNGLPLEEAAKLYFSSKTDNWTVMSKQMSTTDNKGKKINYTVERLAWFDDKDIIQGFKDRFSFKDGYGAFYVTNNELFTDGSFPTLLDRGIIVYQDDTEDEVPVDAYFMYKVSEVGSGTGSKDKYIQAMKTGGFKEAKVEVVRTPNTDENGAIIGSLTGRARQVIKFSDGAEVLLKSSQEGNSDEITQESGLYNFCQNEADQLLFQPSTKDYILTQKIENENGNNSQSRMYLKEQLISFDSVGKVERVLTKHIFLERYVTNRCLNDLDKNGTKYPMLKRVGTVVYVEEPHNNELYSKTRQQMLDTLKNTGAKYYHSMP